MHQTFFTRLRHQQHSKFRDARRRATDPLVDLPDGGIAVDHELRGIARQVRGHLQGERLATLHVCLWPAALPPAIDAWSLAPR